MEKTIVILHGWGKRGSAYKEIQNIFEKKGYKVFSPDLPGFGDEKLKNTSLYLDDYVEFVESFYKRNKIEKAVIIAHSFGGRIAAKFSVKNPYLVYKLIFTGAPLIKKPLSLRKKIIVGTAKVGKGILEVLNIDYKRMRKLVYYSLGEWDYYKANSMREIFRNIIDEDLSSMLPLIAVPTLVLWGEKDTFVSKKIGKEIAKTIPNALYVEIQGASHKVPYAEPEKFAEEVLRFIA